jgi:hypothetical protein
VAFSYLYEKGAEVLQKRRYQEINYSAGFSARELASAVRHGIRKNMGGGGTGMGFQVDTKKGLAGEN